MPETTETRDRSPKWKPGLRQGAMVTNSNRILEELRETLNKVLYRPKIKAAAMKVSGPELLRASRAHVEKRDIQSDQLQSRLTKAGLHNFVANQVEHWLHQMKLRDRPIPETSENKGHPAIENLWVLAAFKVEYLENGMPMMFVTPTLGVGRAIGNTGGNADLAAAQQIAFTAMAGREQDDALESEDTVDSFRITCAFVDLSGSPWQKRHQVARGGELKPQILASADEAMVLLREQYSSDGGYDLRPSELPRAARLVANVRLTDSGISKEMVVAVLENRYSWETIEKNADRYVREQAMDAAAFDQGLIKQITALLECGESDEGIAKVLPGASQALVAKIRAERDPGRATSGKGYATAEEAAPADEPAPAPKTRKPRTPKVPKETS